MAEYKGASREGQRAQALLKKREKMKEDMEARKKKIAEVILWIFLTRFQPNWGHFSTINIRAY